MIGHNMDTTLISDKITINVIAAAAAPAKGAAG